MGHIALLVQRLSVASGFYLVSIVPRSVRLIITFLFQGMDINSFKDAFESPKVDFVLSHAVYCRDVLKLKKGQRAVISNGRVSSFSSLSDVFKTWPSRGTLA